MIVVESELTRPLRDWLDTESTVRTRALTINRVRHGRIATRGERFAEAAFHKATYLAGCHLCAGTWIALLLTALVHDRTFGSGVVAWVLSALLVKAIAHLLLITQRFAEAAS